MHVEECGEAQTIQWIVLPPNAEDRAAKRPSRPRAANRGSLPGHLPRIEEVIAPEGLTCACGGCLHCIGEDGEATAPLMEWMAPAPGIAMCHIGVLLHEPLKGAIR